jgi:hypothetical protein
VLRRFLHGFFAFAVLLGSLAAEPSTTAALPAHHDCCCGDESSCPCDMPRAPQAPRGPCAPAAAATPATLPTATKVQAQARRQAEPLPWADGSGAACTGNKRIDPTVSTLPRDLPRPPDRSLRRLATLSTFRI